MSEAQPKSFTGRRRSRKTAWSVKAGDIIAQVLITLGGIGTILAVLTVCLYLFFVVIPLFYPAEITVEERVTSVAPDEVPLYFEIEEYQKLSWAFWPDGRVTLTRISTNEVIYEQKLFEDKNITASSFANDSSNFIVGFDNGQVQYGTIEITATLPGQKGYDLTDEEIEDLLGKLSGENAPDAVAYQDGLISLTAAGQLRKQSLSIEVNDPVDAATNNKSAVRFVDYTEGTTSKRFISYLDDHTIWLGNKRASASFLAFGATSKPRLYQIPFDKPEGDIDPMFFQLTGSGRELFIVWKDGLLYRYNIASPTRPVKAEVHRIVDDGEHLTDVAFMVLSNTLITGDSKGYIRGWFLARGEYSTTADRSDLMQASQFGPFQSPVSKIRPSSSSRLFMAGFENGDVGLFQMTTLQKLALINMSDESISNIALSPHDHGALIFSDKLSQWHIEIPHPDISFSALFAPVWYENQPQPEFRWQSTGGQTGYEAKLNLIPLIFGTLKGTFYAMIFSIPIALLAAIYTSEFLNPKVKLMIKPVIEMMASLPSVILGFLAGIVIAKYVETAIPTTLAWFVCIPLAFLIGSYIWQLIPYKMQILGQPYRLIFVFIALFTGVYVATFVGPMIETYMFSGDTKLWLDGQIGTGFPGWFFIFIPLAGLVTIYLVTVILNPYLRSITSHWGHTSVGALDLVKFLLTLAVVGLLAAAFAYAMGFFGLDPRGPLEAGGVELSPTQTYIQRNSLIVGFIMGFAVIPIIYTISEDALSSVPEHLRSASLGAGATPWQTAMRIILPTAMSGLFSAVMIGLGRAVGETMIVLMAAGNTPIMEMNIFNGFRTLASNIAIELPEAVQNSTHYRTLFLNALCLFVMTFLVNTLAEWVRLRFRKRAHEL